MDGRGNAYHYDLVFMMFRMLCTSNKSLYFVRPELVIVQTNILYFSARHTHLIDN